MRIDEVRIARIGILALCGALGFVVGLKVTSPLIAVLCTAAGTFGFDLCWQLWRARLLRIRGESS